MAEKKQEDEGESKGHLLYTCPPSTTELLSGHPHAHHSCNLLPGWEPPISYGAVWETLNEEGPGLQEPQ